MRGKANSKEHSQTLQEKKKERERKKHPRWEEKKKKNIVDIVVGGWNEELKLACVIRGCFPSGECGEGVILLIHREQ